MDKHNPTAGSRGTVFTFGINHNGKECKKEYTYV